jgi:hypothetical protein
VYANLLDVVVAQGAAVLQLLSSEDQTLLVRGNSLLVLDLALDIVDGVARFDLEGDGLTREGLDEAVGNISTPCAAIGGVSSPSASEGVGRSCSGGTYICTVHEVSISSLTVRD